MADLKNYENFPENGIIFEKERYLHFIVPFVTKYDIKSIQAHFKPVSVIGLSTMPGLIAVIFDDEFKNYADFEVKS